MHKDANVMRVLIEKYPPPFPENVNISYDLKCLIYDLLSKDWGQRIGSERQAGELLKHPYFTGEEV